MGFVSLLHLANSDHYRKKLYYKSWLFFLTFWFEGLVQEVSNSLALILIHGRVSEIVTSYCKTEVFIQQRSVSEKEHEDRGELFWLMCYFHDFKHLPLTCKCSVNCKFLQASAIWEIVGQPEKKKSNKWALVWWECLSGFPLKVAGICGCRSYRQQLCGGLRRAVSNFQGQQQGLKFCLF